MMRANAEKAVIIKLEQTLYHNKPFVVDLIEEHAAVVKAWGLGVLRRYAFYNFCLERFLKKETAGRIKAYLMLVMFRIDSQSEDHAKLVNHLVDKAKALQISPAAVNAVARRYMIEKNKLEQKTRGIVYVQYNMRQGLLDRVKNQHHNWRELIRRMQQAPSVCLRVNTAKVGLSEFEAALSDQKIRYLKDIDPKMIVIQSGTSVTRLPGFSQGWFTVISAANQKILATLPQPDNKQPLRLLDACAAPGGKAFLLREQYGPKAEITATDIDLDRIQQLEDNNTRLGLNLRCQQQNWEVPQKQLGTFDGIWADVPCSATGVIAKHPEIAINKRDDLQNMDTQKRILTHLWQVLNPGGFLIYSTCSILEEENGGMIQWFLTEHIDACIHKPSEQDEDIHSQHGEYLTSEQSCDYIYCCVIKKSVSS